MKNFLLLLIFGLAPCFIFSQVNLKYHSRVGNLPTAEPAPFEVLEGYLNSNPGSKLSSEEYWSQFDQEHYPDVVDLSQNSLFQFEPNELLRFFQPLVLKAGNVRDHFEIQVMFHHPSDAKQENSMSPFAILTYYLVQEEGGWKLTNPLRFRSSNWNTKRIGSITYHFPPDHHFNPQQGRQSTFFCKTLCDRLKTDIPEIQYYICNSGDQLGWLLGFDFFFAGYTTGKAFISCNLLFSGMGSEYYPHEMAHLCARQSKNKFIDEGIATYFGGTGNMSYLELKNEKLPQNWKDWFREF